MCRASFRLVSCMYVRAYIPAYVLLCQCAIVPQMGGEDIPSAPRLRSCGSGAEACYLGMSRLVSIARIIVHLHSCTPQFSTEGPSLPLAPFRPAPMTAPEAVNPNLQQASHFSPHLESQLPPSQRAQRAMEAVVLNRSRVSLA